MISINKIKGILLSSFLSIFFLTGIIPFNRILENFLSLVLVLLVVFFLVKKIKISEVLAIITLAIILLISLFKTYFLFEMIPGYGTFIKYLLYILIFYYSRYLDIHTLNSFLLTNKFICFFSVIFGLLLGRFQFLNGSDRFLGLSDSSAAFSLFCATTLLSMIIINKKWKLVEMIIFGVIFVGLFLTESRQPLLGLLLIIFFYFLGNYQKFIFSFFGILLFIYFDLANSFESRLLTSLIALADNVDYSNLLDSIASVDGSALARVNYLLVSWNYIYANVPFFGAGLNSFQLIYQDHSGIIGVAPHFDLILFLVEFGIIGTLIIFFVLATMFFKGEKTLKIIIIFWVLALSLNNPFFYTSIFFTLLFVFRLHRHESQIKQNYI